MKSMQIESFGAPLVECETERPRPTGAQVLVKVLRCGVCHTDLHMWQGYYDLGDGNRLDLTTRGIELPVVPGHEIYGEIVAVGPDANALLLGKRGVVYPFVGCGQCRTCARGDTHLCTAPQFLGIWRPGGYGEYVVVPDESYIFETDGIDPSVAATLACSGLTSYGAILKLGMIDDDDWIALIGAGGVGLAGVAFAKALGITNLVVFDLAEEKRDLAIRAGARMALDPADNAAVSDLMTRSGGGFRGIVDFVGSAATFELAEGLLCKGGRYVIVGLYGGRASLRLPLVPLRAISIIGSYVGSLQEMEEMMALVRDGAIAAVPYRECAPQNVNIALQSLHEGKVDGRIVLSREHAG